MKDNNAPDRLKINPAQSSFEYNQPVRQTRMVYIRSEFVVNNSYNILYYSIIHILSIAGYQLLNFVQLHNCTINYLNYI